VQFWKRGESHQYPGYTTNISTTGMFLATNSPQPPGTRLRIEVLEGERGFVVEGVVAHARKTRADLIRLSQPGMGVRFLAVEELVRELIPVLPGETEEIPDDKPDAAPRPVSPPPPAAPRPATMTVPPPQSAPARPEPAPVPPPTPPLPSSEASGAFKVGFLGPAEFLEVFQRDIVNGGLFVSTRYPGRLQEAVQIEIHPPIPGIPPVLLRARVVQRFEPHEGSFGPNLLAGMGVEILELATVLEDLRPIVERLKARA